MSTERSVPASVLANMTQSLDGLDQSAAGYQWRKGWNAAIQWAIDYAAAPAQPAPQPLTDEQKKAITHELNQARCHEKRTVGNLELTDRIARAVLAAQGGPR